MRAEICAARDLLLRPPLRRTMINPPVWPRRHIIGYLIGVMSRPGPQGKIVARGQMEDRMKKFLLAGVALSALLGGSAGAAALGRPAPVYAPPPVIVPLFTWTGCYVGANGGGVWARNDWNDSF